MNTILQVTILTYIFISCFECLRVSKLHKSSEFCKSVVHLSLQHETELSVFNSPKSNPCFYGCLHLEYCSQEVTSSMDGACAELGLENICHYHQPRLHYQVRCSSVYSVAKAACLTQDVRIFETPVHMRRNK